jgi:nucleotide-binding universal stress UspA family protein
MIVHPTYLGIFLAIVFSLSMGSLLWWMLHPPKPVPLVAAKVRRAVDAIKTILVPVVGGEYSDRGIELACRLGKEQNANILLVNVIEVPLSLPLGAHMPGHEVRAEEVLSQGKAIVENHNMIAQTRIERARYAADKIADIVKKEGISLVVMGLKPRTGGVENVIGRTTEMLLRKLPCEIILDAKPSE